MNSIEGEVRELLEDYEFDIIHFTWEEYQDIRDKYDGEIDNLWDKLTQAILKLTNLKPLSEKEIEKFLQDYVHLGTCAFVEGCHENTELAEAIVAHFSKQIKYPEKKEFKDDNLHTHYWEQGYNQAISDMRQLNGEGGV